MCLGLNHLQIGKMSLESCDVPKVWQKLNSIVVLWLPPERNVGVMFVLILLIKQGLDGVGMAGRGVEIQKPMELCSPPWVSIFCLAGWVEKVRGPGARDAGRACWTSPGEHDIRECLSCGEEGKDDPIHHPLYLRVQRAVSAGAWRTSARQLCGRYCGEGTLRTSTLPEGHTRAGGRHVQELAMNQGLVSANSIGPKLPHI